ncbi:unnamed protein product, partial [Discosporangium mesarthrocarpum]
SPPASTAGITEIGAMNNPTSTDMGSHPPIWLPNPNQNRFEGGDDLKLSLGKPERLVWSKALRCKQNSFMPSPTSKRMRKSVCKAGVGGNGEMDIALSDSPFSSADTK